MMFHELIQAFGTRLNLAIESDANGVYSFDIDHLHFTIHDLSPQDQVAFTGDLGLPPTGQTLEGLYRLLLESQYLFQETHGATFSIHPDTKHITLCRVLPLMSLDADSFFAAVEQFVNTLEAWAEIIRNYRSAEADTESAYEPELSFLSGDILHV